MLTNPVMAAHPIKTPNTFRASRNLLSDNPWTAVRKTSAGLNPGEGKQAVI